MKSELAFIAPIIIFLLATAQAANAANIATTFPHNGTWDLSKHIIDIKEAVIPPPTSTLIPISAHRAALLQLPTVPSSPVKKAIEPDISTEPSKPSSPPSPEVKPPVLQQAPPPLFRLNHKPIRHLYR